MYFIINLFALIQASYSQWINQINYLSKQETFSQSNGFSAYTSSGLFQQLDQSTANFITCSVPQTSYITLNSTYYYAETYFTFSFQNENYISFDLYFHGTSLNQIVVITIGTFTYQYTFVPPTQYALITGFCDNINAEVRTLNFSIPSQFYNKIKFNYPQTGNGQVSIKNLYVSMLQCHMTCTFCTGPEFNQCTGCYYGTPIDNICPPCPSNQYFMKTIGCKPICHITSSFYSNGFCQNYPYQSIEIGYLNTPITSTHNIKWSIIYDPIHLDTSPTPVLELNSTTILYGIFKYNAGIYRFMNQISVNQNIYLIGLKITIVTFNAIPIDCAILFKINQTYIGSLLNTSSGIQAHNIFIYNTKQLSGYETYSSRTVYDLITYIDIPKYPFLFSAYGNYTISTAGWGIVMIEVASGYCHQNCLLCEVPFQCTTCKSNFVKYRDGSCISSCSNLHQKLINSYCQDYDDETPYSKVLVKEHINNAGDPFQFEKYTLISQNGVNFLKGSDIFYSYWNQTRVFGGPLVWAQAKFSRCHNSIQPHHSITIEFYILYGPSFPSDGKFIYSIDNNTPIEKQTNTATTNNDGTYRDIVYEKIDHNLNTLTITWECFGSNNEPISAYCGFYNYYIAVHYCQPYCLQCTNQNTCTQWNSTYSPSIVKFSQAECSINQYYDKESLNCLNCPSSCQTCTSKINCLTCQPTYTKTKLGCVCNNNQYEESNQCFSCPIECYQCLNPNYCLTCLATDNRQLQNGQCNCFDGYYSIQSIAQCQLCHLFCKTCTGPTSNDCLICKTISNIENIGTTCQCPIGTSYDNITNSCSTCHSSCQTCFRITIDGCLTCNSSLKRILKGLRCECEPGYYEQNDICINCPSVEDQSISQCFKLCNNNQLIWHTNTCNSCDSGFQLVSGECQPICGDLLIKGYEQCEDNNSIMDDLCYNCQYQCPINCLICDQTTILPCPDVCGDGIITGNEECEDGNTIQYDGCFNCQYQCQLGCTKCIEGECFECATAGWYLDPTVNPWVCKETCGDLLVVGSEQCDDGNTNDNDGCKNCRYFCRAGCSECNYDTKTCLSCEIPGFTPFSFYCRNICGDGLVVVDPYGFYSEQCDDGNTINNDGCSSTCNFQCQPNSICLNCVNNRCSTCSSGYFLSDNQICLPICGDSIQKTEEKCEDSFILPYKGCQNCKPKCQQSCQSCDTTGKGCLSCKTGYQRINNLCYSICGDQIITSDEQCDDGNLIFGDGCHFCQFTCQHQCLYCIQGVCQLFIEEFELIQSQCQSQQQYEIIIHDKIDQMYKIDRYNKCKYSCDINCQLCEFGICQLCKFGFNFSNGFKCVQDQSPPNEFFQYCSIQIGNESKACENLVKLEKIQETCLHDKYQNCPKNCKSCQEFICVECVQGYFGSLCLFEIGDIREEVYQDDHSNSNCDNNCISCLQGTCSLCQNGSYLFNNKCIETIFHHMIYNNVEIERCGDQKLGMQEECEDENIKPYDGCFNCKFQCDLNCLDCLFGICQTCIQGYIMDDNSSCEPECGDGILIPFSNEQCDDANQIEDDECNNCKFNCQSYCLNCNLQQCFNCEKGFYSYQKECLPQCGDGIIIQEFEDCDDENDEQFDGCYLCKFQCQSNCEECRQGICIKEYCPQGTIRTGDSCQSFCGDLIIVENEQCDDGNTIMYDGCFNCEYQCIQNCKICDNGTCISCIENYEFKDNQCVKIDSFNSITTNSGLSLSLNYSINPETISNSVCRNNECSYSQRADMKVIFVNQKFNQQFVQIYFNQEVRLNEKQALEQKLFNISIQDLDTKSFNIQVQSIQDLSFDLLFAQYEVIIEILQPLQIRPILLIQLIPEVINSNNQTILNNNQSLFLEIPKILSEETKQTSISAQKSSTMFMIGAVSLSFFSLLSGDSSIFVETLNILQYQSFLRFININYPENLYIYFQSQDLLSINQYFKLIELDDYMDQITRKEDQQIQLNGKFQEYNIDADLFTNILPQIIQVLGFLILISISKYMYNIHFKLFQYQRFNLFIISQKSKIMKFFITLMFKFIIRLKKILRLRYHCNYDSLRMIIHLNHWDLLFTSFLQLNYNRMDNIRNILSAILAFFIIILHLGFILKQFRQCIQKKNKKNLSKMLERKFMTLDICRTIFFHSVLITFQKQPILQCLLIFVSSLSQCFFIFKYKQCSKIEKLVSLLIEGKITIFTLSLFFYIDIKQSYLSYENQVILGFIHMGLLILSLVIVFAQQLIPKLAKVCGILSRREKIKVASHLLFI